jgi:hypothetical protein
MNNNDLISRQELLEALRIINKQASAEDGVFATLDKVINAVGVQPVITPESIIKSLIAGQEPIAYKYDVPTELEGWTTVEFSSEPLSVLDGTVTTELYDISGLKLAVGIPKQHPDSARIDFLESEASINRLYGTVTLDIQLGENESFDSVRELLDKAQALETI